MTSITRTTRETDIRLQIGAAEAEVRTPVPVLTHFLTSLALTSALGLVVQASGDIEVDPHHLIEDVGIVLGQALFESTAGYAGIERYAERTVAMDDALASVAIDLSGRSGAYLHEFPAGSVGVVATEALAEFFHGLARGGRITLHLRMLAGENVHHRLEAAFKALGLALRDALQPRGDGPLSTKGVIA